MTLLEEAPVIETVAAIDQVFTEDHWVCCDLPEGFVGITTTVCGKEIMEYEPEFADGVSCHPCSIKMVSDPGFCPLKGRCTTMNLVGVIVG